MSKDLKFQIIITLGSILVVYFLKLTVPISDLHNFRQAQTLMTARVLAQEEFDLLHPQIDFEGNPGIQVQEFPFFQMLVSFFYSSNLAALMAARLLNIGLTFVTALYLVNLSRCFSGIRTGWVAAILFLLTPFQIVFTNAALIDILAQASGIAFFYHSFRYVQTRKGIQLISSVLWFATGLFTKYSSMAVYVPPVLFLLWKNHKQMFPRRAWTLLPFALVCVLFTAWMWHAMQQNRIHTVQSAMHGLTQEMLFWNFGDWEQRTSSNYYFNLAHRLPSMLPGFFGVIALIAGFFIHPWQSRSVLLWWFVGAALYLEIWVNLNYIHEYYQLPLFPFLNFLAAITLVKVVGRLKIPKGRHGMKMPKLIMHATALLVAAFVMISRDEVHDLFRVSEETIILPRKIQELTDKSEIVGIYLQEVVSGPIYLYNAERRGLLLTREDFSDDQKLKMLIESKGMNAVFLYYPVNDESQRRQRDQIKAQFHSLRFTERFEDASILIMTMPKRKSDNGF